MSPSKCDAPCVPITRLKEASASLVAAFKNYLDICRSLAADLRYEEVNVKDIATGIDSALETVHTAVISQHLDESYSILRRTQNTFISPLFRFPPEVMSQIFEDAIFDPRDSGTSTLQPLSQHVRLIYRRLHNLVSVCSIWRDIITTRQILWSVLPMIKGFPTVEHDLSQLRLERAGDSRLYLAADFEWMTFDNLKWNLSDVLVDYGARFYSVNVTADKHSIIQDTISMLLSSKGGPPESLSQLSIQFKNKGASHHTNAPPFHPYCVTPLESHKDWFARLVGGLTAFRISGTLFQWDDMAFSTRLVEFRLDHVTLGFDEMLVSLMRALSSASELRDLKIISVNTYRLQSETSDNITPLSVSFPRLQDLYLQDLHFNTLEILLPIVTPGSHHLTLYFTEKGLHDNLFSDNDGDWQKTLLRRVQIADLPIVLGPIPVHTLMLSQRPGSNTRWLTSNTFCGLLEALPALRTLKMDYWHFDQILCADLNRRNHPRLPALENLHLTNTIIHKTYGPREMLASHPLQQVILGEVEHTHTGEPSSHKPLQESSDIVQWLRGTVPDFRLIDRPYRSPEFCLDEWQLW